MKVLVTKEGQSCNIFKGNLLTPDCVNETRFSILRTNGLQDF